MKYWFDRSTGDAYEEHSIEGTLTEVLVVLDALGLSDGEDVSCSLDNTEDNAYTPDNTEEWEGGTLGASEEHAHVASEEDTRKVNDILRAAKQKIPDWAVNQTIDYSRIPLDWKHAWIAQDRDGTIFAYSVRPFVKITRGEWMYEGKEDLTSCKCLYVHAHMCSIEDYKSRCFQYF